MKNSAPTVVGIDVGGTKKGFHAIALRDTTIVTRQATCDVEALAAWCHDLKASAIGIDAPCQWSLTGRGRSCERALAGLGMSCFYTPIKAIGAVHPFYQWMACGAELFRLLAPGYRLYSGRVPQFQPLCFETFPQAIACALAGKKLSAKHKRVERRRLLETAGIATDSLATIDAIDAALCAVAAQHVLAGTFQAFGDPAEGFIVFPSCS